MKIKNTLVLVFLSILTAGFVYSQQVYTSIPLSNTKPNGIGFVKSGNENWKPLFFDIDSAGNVHIPDFYKGRIVVFGAKNGKSSLIEEYEAGEFISPRMNYFSLYNNNDQNPLWVTWNDSVLSVFSKEGIVMQRQFPIGTLPARIIPTDQLLFVQLAASESCLIFGPFDNANSSGRYASVSAQPIGSYTRKIDGSSFPMVRFKQYDLPLTLNKLQNTSPEIEISPLIQGIDISSSYLLNFAMDNVYWLTLSNSKRNGILIKTNMQTETTQYYSFSCNPDGFWTILTPDGKLFKNSLTEDTIEIHEIELNLIE